jgi:hypothetical protein
MNSHDIVIAVKRVTDQLAADLQRTRAFVVWDCVDWYSQPNKLARNDLIEATRAYGKRMGANALIGATERMARDLGTPHWLPHHGWDRGLVEVRPDVRNIGYEGSARYVEALRPQIEKACAKIGARFCVNPGYLKMDAVLAMRSKDWTSYASQHWKSAVKLSNAQIAGMPFVCEMESGYLEQDKGDAFFIYGVGDLSEALARLASADRGRIQKRMRGSCLTLEAVAARYRAVLNAL